MINYINTHNGKDLFWFDLLNNQEKFILFSNLKDSNDWLKIIDTKNATISLTLKNTNIDVLNEYIKPKEVLISECFDFEKELKWHKKQNKNKKKRPDKPYYNKSRY